jgi:membrane associated rhomboid family serine protease
VGASGAISAIMGAYLVLYPKNRVQTLFFFVVFFRVVPLPAWVFLGYWLLIQILLSASQPAGVGGGVAIWAHIGGFLAGVALVKLFENRALVDAKRAQVKLERNQIRYGGWL